MMIIIKKPFEYKVAACILIFLLSFSYAKADSTAIRVGAERLEMYLSIIKTKRIGMVVNQTSMVGQMHLVDTLVKLGLNIKTIFAPEHGFRGNYEAGAHVNNETDKSTGIPVVSLYGKNKKPTKEQLKPLDIIIFDIQDVGARFYTYISTLHYVMEACAESNKLLLVLDRPNPNGFYVAGPLLDTAFKSFVGMHPIPVVHGMTIGEYSQMINGEKWLTRGVKCSLIIIDVQNYNHKIKYHLPKPPSPNLVRMQAIYLYPTTCFFEGTNYSLGRGTSIPFECAGRPGLKTGSFNFTPIVIKGVSDNPPHVNKSCNGYIYTSLLDSQFFKHTDLIIEILVAAFQNDPEKDKFFNSFFDKLAGSDKLRNQIVSGMSAQEIKNSWKNEVVLFKQKRKQYLRYEDFE
jgi:uncharacterized protein YbbC (DUF1343 family)